jgi:outer membrane protein TolC
MFNEGNYSLGLSADLPLDRKSERNLYRAALITIQQRQRDYDDVKSKVELDVRNSYRRLLQEADSYITQKKSLDLAQKRVDISALLWQTGRANTRDILESQDALLSAQNSLTAALVDHTIAKLTFFKDIDVLQVKPDGMWEQTKQ